MTILGGIMMSVGLLLSSFCNDMRIMYFTHGILFGIGSSLSYLPALVMVALYFEKRRSLATGMAAAGGNIGAIALAPLQQFIVESFGWRNCFRFLSGFSLLTVVCGVIFKPLPDPHEEDIPLEQSSACCIQRDTTISSQPLELFRIIRDCKFPKSPRFLVWSVAGTIACFGYFMPHVHLVSILLFFDFNIRHSGHLVELQQRIKPTWPPVFCLLNLMGVIENEQFPLAGHCLIIICDIYVYDFSNHRKIIKK